MFDALPDDWRIGSLGDLMRESAERIAPSQAAGAFSHYVGLEHIEQGTGRLSGFGRIDDVVSQKSVFQSGDILYGKLRPNLRKVARPEFGGVCSTDIVVFKAKHGADPDFAFQLLQSDPLVDHAVATAAGTKMPRTHARSILSFEVALPPPDEQRRIAEVLRSVDGALVSVSALRLASDALLARYRREVLGPLISDDADCARRLGDICDLGRGFAFKSEDYVADGVLNFRVTNVGRPASNIGEKRFLPDAYLKEYADYRLAGGEIVLVMVGATVGKLGRVPKELCPALLNQNMWTLTPRAGTSGDLLWHLAHVLVEKKVHSAQGGAYSFLTKQDFLRHRIEAFDPDFLMPHIDAMSAIETYSGRIAEEEVALTETKRLLSEDLLSGRVRVPA